MAQINARDVTVEVQIDGSRLRAFADGLREAGVVAGAAASALGNVGREAIQTAQRFERDMARLDAILREYGCRGVRATNRGDHIIFEAAFPDNVPRYSIPSRLIHDSVDWVDLVAQRFIDFIRQCRQENEPILELDENVNLLRQYIDAVRRHLGGHNTSITVGVYTISSSLNNYDIVEVEFAFQDGEVVQHIDRNRIGNGDREYVGQLWQDIMWAKAILINVTNEGLRHNGSIVSVTPARHASRGITYGDLMAARDIMMGGSRRSFTDEENNRARDLLVSCLNDEQREVFERYNFFDITGQSGEKYRIKHGKAYNVTRLSDKVELCAGPADNVPTYDYMLAQKIWLEADEAGFLQDANKRRGFFGPFDGEVLNIHTTLDIDPAELG